MYIHYQLVPDISTHRLIDAKVANLCSVHCTLQVYVNHGSWLNLDWTITLSMWCKSNQTFRITIWKFIEIAEITSLLKKKLFQERKLRSWLKGLKYQNTLLLFYEETLTRLLKITLQRQPPPPKKRLKPTSDDGSHEPLVMARRAGDNHNVL